VELGGFVTLSFDCKQKVFVIVVRYRKFIQEAILLEYSKSKMKERGISERFIVFKYVKVPNALVEILHHFDRVIPDPGVDINDLSKLFVIFLILIILFVFSMNLFQEVVKITLEPFRCIISSIGCDIQPSFGVYIHILLFI